MVCYDNTRFRVPGEADSPVAHYHQDGDLVWAEFGGGGGVRRGSLVGTCDADGVLRLSYCMLLLSGEMISGQTRSTSDVLDDGRIRLTEQWERYGPDAATGVSYLEEVPDGEAAPAI
jgi:hypothetical protein